MKKNRIPALFVVALGSLLLAFLLLRPRSAEVEVAAAPLSVSSLEITAMVPESPSTRGHGKRFDMTISYQNAGPNPVQIFARPYTDGMIGGISLKHPEFENGFIPPQRNRFAWHFSSHPSPVYDLGSGNVEGWFAFREDALVNEVRVVMIDTKTKEVTATAILPVEITWMR
jgi:hypothetical protein